MGESNGLVVMIRGGGEVASGVAHRLHLSRFRVCLTERAEPLAVSRGITFSEAVFDGSKTIEGVTAERVAAMMEDVRKAWGRGNIALVVDPAASIREHLKPAVVIDGTMAKRNLGTRITDAPLVIGLGPGFCAGKDVHVVVETNHSSNLGKVILDGEAEKNTGIPIAIGGLTRERVIWAPCAGTFTTGRQIGDIVTSNQVIAQVGGMPLLAPISGVLCGLIRNGVKVSQGDKLIEVDPVNSRKACFVIREKIRAIGAGVLEAIKLKLNVDQTGG